jgi:hypothetical protein
MVGRRRGRGEGSIWFDEKLDRWIAQVTLENGKKKTKKNKTQKEAQKWLLETRKAIKDGTFIEKDQITVEAFLALYIEDIARHTLAPGLFFTYRNNGSALQLCDWL